MRNPPLSRLILGAAVWIALAAGFLAAVGGTRPGEARFPREPAERLLAFVTTSPTRVWARFPSGTSALAGDAVCARREGALVTIGQVRSVTRKEDGLYLWLEFFDPEGGLPAKDARITVVPNPRTPKWVLETLLPPERREELLAALTAFAREHQEEIAETFWVPFESFLRDAFRILAEDLPGAVEKRDDAFQEVLEKHKDRTFKAELMPVLEEEFWPCIQEKSTPLMESVGEELWERLPMWQLGWRYVYQQMPFTDKDMVRNRWRQYMEEEAVPVLKGRTDDFLELARQVLEEMAAKPRVSKALRSCLLALAEDPAFLELLRGTFAEVASPKGRLVATFQERFSHPDFVARLNRLLDALGPTLNRAADRILLDESGRSINPDLVRVLRAQVFNKDACWVLVEPGTGEAADAGHVFVGERYGDGGTP